MDREKDGTAYFNAPACRCCGSRNQKKVGYLTFQCQNTGQVWYYRMTSMYGLVPFVRDVAQGIDEMRREGAKP